MYSTSSEQTGVIWAAHTYNISFTSEIGHFENCTGPNPIPATPFGLDASGNPVTCPAGNSEGFGSNKSPTDGDDGATTDFGRNAQYGSLLSSTYLAFGGGGATIQRINNFRQIISNPCPAGGNQG